MRFVHADVDEAGSEIVGRKGEQLIEKGVRLFLVDQQYVRRIHDVAVYGQFDEIGEMRQRLNAGNELYAPGSRIGVDFTDLFARVAAAEIPEIRFALRAEGILGIQLQRVIPHLCQTIDEFLHDGGFHHRVSRTTSMAPKCL